MVACGLSLGKDWNGCTKPYEATLSSLPNEHAVSVFLYTKAWENFLAHPSVLIGQLWANCSEFIHHVWSFMFSSYISLYDCEWRNRSLPFDSAGWNFIRMAKHSRNRGLILDPDACRFLYGTFLMAHIRLPISSSWPCWPASFTSGEMLPRPRDRSGSPCLPASLPSAALVMTADGWRALHVTHLFVAGFLVAGPRGAAGRS